jgi:pyruvate dehydrogenase E1 component
MLPFYIYYSIFGFQRVGDLIWAAADQRARGFLVGATAGRTTLSGEGLQHQDGSSHVIAATIPNCRAYDPAFAYEAATIVDYGARAMMERGNDEFYYLTVMNESYAHPSMPLGVEADIVKGLYRLAVHGQPSSASFVRLLGSGAIVPEVMKAASALEHEWGISSEVWSATSYSELARDAREVERRKRLNPSAEPITSHLEVCLPGDSPIIAASDYVRGYPQLIASYVQARFTVLGTDGFGRSDTRAALRAFFEVDSRNIIIAALAALASKGIVAKDAVAAAIARYGVDEYRIAPWTC